MFIINMLGTVSLLIVFIVFIGSMRTELVGVIFTFLTIAPIGLQLSHGITQLVYMQKYRQRFVKGQFSSESPSTMPFIAHQQ